MVPRRPTLCHNFSSLSLRFRVDVPRPSLRRVEDGLGLHPDIRDRRGCSIPLCRGGVGCVLRHLDAREQISLGLLQVPQTVQNLRDQEERLDPPCLVASPVGRFFEIHVHLSYRLLRRRARINHSDTTAAAPLLTPPPQTHIRIGLANPTGGAGGADDTAAPPTHGASKLLYPTAMSRPRRIRGCYRVGPRRSSQNRSPR